MTHGCLTPHHCCCLLLVHVAVRYYVYKICMINTLSFLWSLIMFFDDPTDLMGRMSTTITLFLASVAFLFVVNDKLPKACTSPTIDTRHPQST